MVDTKNVPDRRTLRFNTPAELMRDVERLVAADRTGKLRRLGNWTLGQNLGHIATFINFAYDGYPQQPPWLVKAILKLFKNKYIHKGLPAGAKIPGTKDGTWGTEVLSTDEGLAKFNAAWARLKAGAPSKPNVIFGPLSPEEWTQLHLRHCELHLSFLIPG